MPRIQKTLAREQEWIASSPKARQAKSKARYQRYEELLKQASEKQTTTAQIVIPVAERLGDNVVDFEGLSKGLRRPRADRQSHLQAAARRHCRRDRRERRRQDHAVPA
jgi:ATPase subunit of ABC transporter with duplicated ATPase domains